MGFSFGLIVECFVCSILMIERAEGAILSVHFHFQFHSIPFSIADEFRKMRRRCARTIPSQQKP
jgi:hypothetical protein